MHSIATQLLHKQRIIYFASQLGHECTRGVLAIPLGTIRLQIVGVAEVSQEENWKNVTIVLYFYVQNPYIQFQNANAELLITRYVLV